MRPSSSPQFLPPLTLAYPHRLRKALHLPVSSSFRQSQQQESHILGRRPLGVAAAGGNHSRCLHPPAKHLWRFSLPLVPVDMKSAAGGYRGDAGTWQLLRRKGTWKTRMMAIKNAYPYKCDSTYTRMGIKTARGSSQAIQTLMNSFLKPIGISEVNKKYVLNNWLKRLFSSVGNVHTWRKQVLSTADHVAIPVLVLAHVIILANVWFIIHVIVFFFGERFLYICKPAHEERFYLM